MLFDMNIWRFTTITRMFKQFLGKIKITQNSILFLCFLIIFNVFIVSLPPHKCVNVLYAYFLEYLGATPVNRAAACFLLQSRTRRGKAAGLWCLYPWVFIPIAALSVRSYSEVWELTAGLLLNLQPRLSALSVSLSFLTTINTIFLSNFVQLESFLRVSQPSLILKKEQIKLKWTLADST